jgi:hypothetical protein
MSCPKKNKGEGQLSAEPTIRINAKAAQAALDSATLRRRWPQGLASIPIPTPDAEVQRLEQTLFASAAEFAAKTSPEEAGALLALMAVWTLRATRRKRGRPRKAQATRADLRLSDHYLLLSKVFRNEPRRVIPALVRAVRAGYIPLPGNIAVDKASAEVLTRRVRRSLKKFGT